MRELRGFLTRRWKHAATKSVFGIVEWPTEDVEFFVAERQWLDNLPNISCVPTGFYVMEPHDGTKYKDTFALISSTVSHHGGEPGVSRSACVLHNAINGLGLQGCQAWGDVLEFDSGAHAQIQETLRATSWIRAKRAEDVKLYLTIREEF